MLNTPRVSLQHADVQPEALAKVSSRIASHYQCLPLHLDGDVLLKKISEILTEGFREVDIVCRYAGDEFVVILPETGITEVKKIAEKLRKAVNKLKLRRPVTLSMGIAKCLKGMNRHDLILKADSALHKAKQDGKNRIFVQET